mmetsp:Transcript_50717/g.45504  ORF Transcript_50717/g.45504 Transcript_50717/m.45504 type:complete len:360 (+) Transcript_50717:212-1291(+)
MMMMAIDKKLAKIAQSKFRVSLPIFLNLVLAIILMVLSISQSFPINEAGEGMILGAFFSGWQRNVCLNRMMQFLSPFEFDFKVDTYGLDFGKLACPWRIRNTIYRLTLICLIIIISLWMLVILYVNSKKNKNGSDDNNDGDKHSIRGAHIWYLLYYFKYLLFLAMVVLFILDCDGAYAGYNACRANFDITGFGPLVLSLLGAAFTTTTAPAWPGGSEVADPGDGTLVVTQFKIADQCHITPYIYTLLVDAMIILTTYVACKLSKFYKFDNNGDDDDYDYDDGDHDGYTKDKKKKKRFRFHKTKKKTNDDDGANNQREGNHNNNNNNNNNSHNPFDTIEEEMFEPPSWNKRKPTYEQNYS